MVARPSRHLLVYTFLDELLSVSLSAEGSDVSREMIVGRALPGFAVDIERDQVCLFARTIGDLRPECHDVEAARSAGYPDVLAPPTYVFSLELRRPQPYAALELLETSLSAALHAGQSFTYRQLCFAGDRLDFDLRITGYAEKRGGALGLLERTTCVRRGNDVVAELVNVLAIRWESVS
jgi:acyl dehydratase